MVRHCAGLLVLVLLMASGGTRAAVSLIVSPDPAVSNQSVELTYTVTGGVDAEPEFSVLDKVFEIINTNRQTTKIWLNGTSKESTNFILNAMPRVTGAVTIPAVSFGHQSSSPRELLIGDAPAPAAGTSDNTDIMLQVSAAPSSPYVQQQVIYTVKILNRVDVANPRLSNLTANGDAVIKQLTTGRQFTETINGQIYDGVEVKYVVFAQKSGTLRLAPLSLAAEVPIGRRSAFDPFAQSLSTRRVESEAVELEVKPVPASFPPGATWLPAKRLRLYEEWEPDVNTTEVGVPLTRTLSLWADGLMAGALPKLQQHTPAGLKLYPDQALPTEQDTANGYSTTLQQKFAIVASQAGTAQIDELTIPWWNVETDQLEFARLPARSLSVSAASGAAPPLDAPAPAENTTTPAAVPSRANETLATPWRLIAALLGLAWMLTLVMWWYQQRRAGSQANPIKTDKTDKTLDPPHSARAIGELKQACSTDNPRGARTALLAWAAAEGGQSRTLNTLRDLGLHAGGPLATEIVALERHLYGADKSDWHGQALWQAFQNRSQHQSTSAVAVNVLPGMFKLSSP